MKEKNRTLVNFFKRFLQDRKYFKLKWVVRAFYVGHYHKISEQKALQILAGYMAKLGHAGYVSRRNTKHMGGTTYYVTKKLLIGIEKLLNNNFDKTLFRYDHARNPEKTLNKIECTIDDFIYLEKNDTVDPHFRELWENG